MLEMPEVQSLATQMQMLVGKKVTGAVAAQTPHSFAWYNGDTAKYGERLRGCTVRGTGGCGGHLELNFGDQKLLFNDGASPHYHAPEERKPDKHQLYVAFEDGSAFSCRVAMYGGMSLFDEGEDCGGYFAVAHDKPSPLTDAFTPQYFADMVAREKPGLTAKALLATEQRIPGLGNGVLQDILFAARVNPRTKLGQLGDTQLEAIYRAVVDKLREMTACGGRDTEIDFLGRPGGYATLLSRKTIDRPCPVCGATIVKQAYMGGSVYYCPSCQPLSK